mmetsp:Transcript_22851/g.32712  ORF Transcript_22851/g.32712 Transcript_22851/m.32712 type:complete len:200 (+) Transcript_22851:273-872(+)
MNTGSLRGHSVSASPVKEFLFSRNRPRLERLLISFGTCPVRAFRLRSKKFNEVKSASSLGIVEERRLLSKSSKISFSNLLIHVGIGPVLAVSFKDNSLRFVKVWKESGIGPISKWVFPERKRYSSSVKLLSASGISPSNRLLLKSICVRFPSLSIDVGMDPSKKLSCSAKNRRLVVRGISVGRDPERSFPLKSMISSCL